MEKKSCLGFVLVGIATVAISVEIVGFISPGWLCLSSKYQPQGAKDLDKSFWSDTPSSWNNTGIFDYDILDDDKNRRRRQDRPSDQGSGSDPGRLPRPDTEKEQNTNRPRGTGLWRQSKPLQSTKQPPAYDQQEAVYTEFRNWALTNDANLAKSLPSDYTDFLEWIGTDKNGLFRMRVAFDKFLDDIGANGEDRARYTSTFAAWFQKARSILPERSWVNTTVSFSKQVDIYNEFREWLPESKADDLSLPSDYRQFQKWIRNSTTRLLKLKPSIDKFIKVKKTSMNTLDRPERDRIMKDYIAVTESWFKWGFDQRKPDDDASQDDMGKMFDALEMDGDKLGMKWKVMLGLWYGKGCIIAGGEEMDCESIDAGRLGEKGFDVGGMTAWNDLRVETVFGLCSGGIGLIGTVLTVKPLCLKGRAMMTTIVGICGLALSCILFLVPIGRVVSIKSSLEVSYKSLEDGALDTQLPWAAAVSGIGACLALVSAGLLAFYTWAEGRNTWGTLSDNSAIVFKNENQPSDGEKGSTENHCSTDGGYDNLCDA